MSTYRVRVDTEVEASNPYEAAWFALKADHLSPGVVSICEVQEREGETGWKDPQAVRAWNLACCGDCEFVFVPGDDLSTIPDLAQRLDPGGMVPVCECPQCGALAYPVQALLRRLP